METGWRDKEQQNSRWRECGEEGDRYADNGCRGSVIGEKYIIDSLLGSGGSGRVYKVYDSHLKCDRAMKEFQPGDKVSVKELEMLKGLRHPAFPVITDYLEEKGQSYLVMEYIEGRNLEKYIKEKGAMGQEQAVKIACELAEVLIYLHESKLPVVYLDMKPANIILDDKGMLHLVDFGTACLRYQEKEKTGCAGTCGYAAPEQLTVSGRGKADERSDIYGLGATLFHMLTGCNPALPPYLIQPIRFYNGGLSKGLEKIVKKATEQEPEKRYQTVRQMKEALEHYKGADRWRNIVVQSLNLIYYVVLMSGLWQLVQEFFRETIRKDRIIGIGLLLSVLYLGRRFFYSGKRNRWTGVRQERSLLLTSKKGKGLLLMLTGSVLGAVFLTGAGMRGSTVLAGNMHKSGRQTSIAYSDDEWANTVSERWKSVKAAEEKQLFVVVRNKKGQKILIRYDAVYMPEDTLKLELPLENFKEGEKYELRLECVNCDTGEISSRTFYLKGVEPCE